MSEPTLSGDGGARRRLRCRIAVAAVLVGVFVTWVVDGPVRLDGTQGPNKGWLSLIVAALALVWIRLLGSPRLGLLVRTGSVALTTVAVVQAVELAREAFRHRATERAA